MDMTALTDGELEDLRIRVLTEQYERRALAEIPAQISTAARTWRDAGRDTAELVEALTGDAPDEAAPPEGEVT